MTIRLSQSDAKRLGLPMPRASRREPGRMNGLEYDQAEVVLELPYPPSVNHYYRTYRGRMLVSAKGRAYRDDVAHRIVMAGNPSLIGKLRVTIHLSPPDNRRRDLDNCLKALLDAMQNAGVYHDDSQIDEMLVKRNKSKKGGLVHVTLASCGRIISEPKQEGGAS